MVKKREIVRGGNLNLTAALYKFAPNEALNERYLFQPSEVRVARVKFSSEMSSSRIDECVGEV